jgi:hypothetical protein
MSRHCDSSDVPLPQRVANRVRELLSFVQDLNERVEFYSLCVAEFACIPLIQ